MASPKVPNYAPRLLTRARLQQGFVTGEMGSGINLHSSNSNPLMSA